MGSLEKLEKNIIQANPLIESRKHMNVTEMRLFGLGLSDINPHIKDDTVYDVEFHDTWITYKELVDLFGSDNGGHIVNLKKQIDKAFQGFIEIPNSAGGFKLRHIYEEMEYFPQEGLLIRFHDKLKPYILDLVGKAYTSYKLKLLFLVSSEYSQRMLELLLKQQGFLKKGNKEVYYEVSIEELRRELNVPDNLYVGRMDNFRSRVLDLPIREINEKTDYIIRYETLKKGRKITGFKFWLKLKEKAELPPPEETPKEPLEERLEREAGQGVIIEYPPSPTQQAPASQKPRGLTDEEQEAYDRMIKRGVDPDVAKNLAKKYDLKIIKRNIKLAIERKNNDTKNLGGVIVSFIQQDKAGKIEIAKKDVKEREDKKQLDRRQAFDTFYNSNMSEIGKEQKQEIKNSKGQIIKYDEPVRIKL